jgi:hypothetical protein
VNYSVVKKGSAVFRKQLEKDGELDEIGVGEMNMKMLRAIVTYMSNWTVVVLDKDLDEFQQWAKKYELVGFGQNVNLASFFRSLFLFALLQGWDYWEQLSELDSSDDEFTNKLNEKKTKFSERGERCKKRNVLNVLGSVQKI